MSQVTNKKIIDSARELLFDTFEDYRWDTKTLTRFLFEGIQKLHMIRPESRYSGTTLVDFSMPENYEGSLSEEFPIDYRWKDAIVHYICARAYQIDNNDTMNAQKYSEHMSLFTTWAKL